MFVLMSGHKSHCNGFSTNPSQFLQLSARIYEVLHHGERLLSRSTKSTCTVVTGYHDSNSLICGPRSCDTCSYAVHHVQLKRQAAIGVFQYTRQDLRLSELRSRLHFLAIQHLSPASPFSVDWIQFREMWKRKL
jgi:hypothetical protein